MARKSLREEVDVIRRYAQLTEPYFKFLQEMFESSKKEDRKWAAEQLKNAFPKFIPQQVGGIDGQPIQVSWMQSQSLIPLDNGQTDSTAPRVVG